LSRSLQFSRVLLRPKASGFGYPYGTGVSGGYVAHTMPAIGKHVATLDEFGDRKPVTIVRRPRTPIQNRVVEQIALSDLGSGYDEWAANCEHDVHRAHTGIPQSPTVNGIKLIGGVALIVGLIKAFSDD
jgi:hypothetical protein